MKIIFHILKIVLLTVITQIGGVIYLISITGIKSNATKYKLKRGILFATLYLATTFLIIPQISPYFGREKIKESKYLVAHSVWYKILNRNYVTPKLNRVLTNVSQEFGEKNNGIKTIYLDANFPFFNDFPLLPHLSHADGKKIDLTFIYESEDHKLTNKKPSRSGYGVYEKPFKNEHNQISVCKNKGYWQYDFPKYLTLGKTHKQLIFSKKATSNLLLIIAKQKNISKIFIEPHLKQRLNLTNSKIRYHGCQAVRHDDHIHIQVK